MSCRETALCRTDTALSYFVQLLQKISHSDTYLLGLLAMIKCSICSYQCDNWYVSNWRFACHMNVSAGSCCPELAQAHSSVALAWHDARGSTPFGVTYSANFIASTWTAVARPEAPPLPRPTRTHAAHLVSHDRPVVSSRGFLRGSAQERLTTCDSDATV